MKDNLIYLFLLAALFLLFLLIPQQKNTKRAGIILLCLSLVAEILICNFHSFVHLPSQYERTEINLESPNVSLSQRTENAATIELSEVNRPVATLQLKLTLPPDTEEGSGTPSVTVLVDACDETQQGYYRSSVAQGQVIRGDERSAYVVLNLSGEVSALRIRLSAEKDQSFTVDGVALNTAVPFRLSAVRLLVTVGAIWSIYALATFPSMRRSFAEERKRCRRMAGLITFGLILAGIALHLLYQYDRTLAFSGGFEQTTGNQISKELVDAFRSGQVSLLYQPPKELLELENPYDWSQRSAVGISYLWDHLLYDGKYYSYYGIAPVLLLFLPYNLLTGYYFPTPEAVLIFSLLGIWFLTLLYLAFCDLFAKRIPVNMVLAGLLVCQLCSGVWYNICSPLFYEIAQSSGFFFTCAGWYLMLRSGVIGKEPKVRLSLVFLSTVCLSLAVLCRPTLALYCIAALVFLFYGLLKRRAIIKHRFPHRTGKLFSATVSYLFWALIGFAAIGGLQMWYNYARFGSIMDFGIQYSLTINDFTKSQFHADFVWIGMHNFLFAAPSLLPQFPYVFSNFSNLGLNGYYFIANRNAVGICFRALPTLGYLGIGAAWRSLTPREKRALLWLGLPICLIMPLGIIFSIWESGYGVRYCADFAWQIILGGIGILYLLYARCAQEQTRRLMQLFFLLSLVVAFVCNFGMIFDYLNLSGHLESQTLSFKRLFDFWK